jgi:hypothetical protein
MEDTPYSQPSDQLIQQQNQEAPQQQQQAQQPAPTTSFTIFVWKFFSVISWLLLIFTSLEAYFHETMFYSMYNTADSYLPLSVKLGGIQSFYLILLFLAFYHFAYLGLYKGDDSITNPLFDRITKLHFIPLFLISFINIINQTGKNGVRITAFESELIADLVFNLIALVFLIIIYSKTVLEHNWYIVLTIKKGLFSCLIILLWHNFFYLIVLVGYAVQSNRLSDNINNFLKGSGIAGSLLVGIGGCIFSFVNKDLIAAATNFLLYVGMVNSFFGTTGKSKSMRTLTGGVADGVIEIIFMIFNFATVIILIFKFNADCVQK